MFWTYFQQFLYLRSPTCCCLKLFHLLVLPTTFTNWSFKFLQLQWMVLLCLTATLAWDIKTMIILYSTSIKVLWRAWLVKFTLEIKLTISQLQLYAISLVFQQLHLHTLLNLVSGLKILLLLLDWLFQFKFTFSMYPPIKKLCGRLFKLAFEYFLLQSVQLMITGTSQLEIHLGK
jgi:hypothetical protein